MKSLELKSANLVVLARSFNPSIASKDWLRAHVFDEEPIDFFSTPLVSAYKTERLELFVDQARLQITCKVVDAETMAAAAAATSSYVARLPHTPYTAIGFNYAWRLLGESDNTEPPSWAFLVKGLPSLDNEFSSYCVTPTILAKKDGAQIRMSVRPSLDPDEPVTISLNRHYDSTDAALIAERARAFAASCREAESLVTSVLLEEHANVTNR